MLSTEQESAIKVITEKKNVFISGNAGTGKSLSYGSKVMVYTGKFKEIQDIKVGDRIMGDDSTPRTVLATSNGYDDLYRVKQVNGDDYIVNGEHILSLKMTYCQSGCINRFINDVKYQKGDIVDISVNDFIKLPSGHKKCLKGYKVPVCFSEKETQIDSYLIGLWLGDSDSNGIGFTNQDAIILHYLANYNCYLQSIEKENSKNYIKEYLEGANLINNKHIPDIYKYNSRENQLKILAGILDTDGNYNTQGHCYDIVQKNYTLAKDIEYIARCLGFTSKVVECQKGCVYKGEYREGIYYRQTICGNGIEEIPCLVGRKKAKSRIQIKNNLHMGITVEAVGQDYYDQGPEYHYRYSIQIDGNQRFILGDHTVTHNSHILKHLKATIPNIHLTASTGIAAVNINGQTLHSWSGIGLGLLPANKITFSGKVISRVKFAKVLAVDEISMISAITFDLVNDVCKLIRKNDKPFGGIQIVLFGDFYQLPPVNGDFCFNSKAWTELKLSSMILKKVFRQSDEVFVGLLNNIRHATLSSEDIALLTERVGQKCMDPIQPTKLVSHNDQADRINKFELDKIQTNVHTFKARYKGTDQLKIEFLKKNCVAYDIIDLKIGSHVMMLRNTYAESGIINGSVGIIKDISTYPVVMFENGVELTIVPEVWALERYDDISQKLVTEASIEQIPLIFSWAITIHKSQGMTLNKIRCDLSKVFTHGQSYVALSRVKTLEGLYIDDIDFNKIKTSEMIVDFYSNLE